MHQGRWKTLILAAALAHWAAVPLPAAADPRNEEADPELPGHSILLENSSIELSYNPEHKQSDWVFYPLGTEQLRSCAKRTNSFRVDPRLAAQQQAQLADYSGSGFDRGHLSPAGDNKFSEEAMRESFLLTNISPQPGSFNRGVWSKLEGLVRAWSKEAQGLWVATGPVLRGGLPSIGASRVSVPEYFYKVISARDGSGSVAFVLPTDAGTDLSRYEMSVDQAEEITGLDFLSGLVGEEETEARFDPRHWDMKAKFSYFPCKAANPDFLDWSWGLTL